MFDIERGEHDLVAGAHPASADRAADIARTDDADLHLVGSKGRKRENAGGNGRSGNEQKLTTTLFHDGNPFKGRDGRNGRVPQGDSLKGYRSVDHNRFLTITVITVVSHKGMPV